MKKKRKGKAGRTCLSLLVIAMLMGVLCPAALADTDGTEPKITQQPDQLVLQLGARWAGVEFELRTDAGMFPVPLVVDSTGVLTMDLGGSKTYTLSCINSSVPIPDPIPEQPEGAGQLPSTTSDSNAQQQIPPEDPQQQDQSAKETDSGIPLGPLVIFLVGLAGGVGGLVALHLSKRRRQERYDEWEEEDEDEY